MLSIIWISALFIMNANSISIPISCWIIAWALFGIQMFSTAMETMEVMNKKGDD